MRPRTLRTASARAVSRVAPALLLGLFALGFGSGRGTYWIAAPRPALAAGEGELSVVQPAPRSDARPTYLEGQVLVRTHAPVQVTNDRIVPTQTVQSLSEAVQSFGGQVDWTRPVRYRDGSALLTVHLPPGQRVQEALHQLQPLAQAGTIAYAQPNYLYYPDELAVPNDPLFPLNYDLHNTGQVFVPPLGLAGTPDADIDAPEAWSVFQPSGHIVIGVIDTGIWINHPDLQGQIWTNPGEIPGNGVDDDGNGYTDDVHGWDFVNDDATVWDVGDDDFHGTHVAGTIGARMNNAIGSAGINPRIQIMSLKFLGLGGGSTANAVRAVEYATRMGASLTTNSWGGGGADQALYDAIKESGEHGLLFVAAAGNEGVDTDASPHFPSSYDLPNILSVASSDWNDQLSSFSNYGVNTVDMAAPGDFILSTYWRLVNGQPVASYAWASGTSMATPHVSGVAALLLDRFPNLPAFPGAPGYQEGQLTIKDLLMYSGDPQPQFVGKMIAPVRLNAYNALTQRMFPIIEAIQVNGQPWGARVVPAAAGTPVEVDLVAVVKTPFSQLASIRWEFGDQSAPLTGTQTEVRHAYRTPGVYVARATVTDAEGDTVVAEATVAVAEPAGQPPLAIVVDDDPDGDSQAAIASALQASWIPYAITDSRALLRLDPAQLREPLFWETGATTSPLDAAEQAFLDALQSAGGRWFLTGQDVLTDLAGTSFARTVLHVSSAQQDVGLSTLAGIDGDPISNGLGVIELQYPAGYRDQADSLVAAADADEAFTSPGGQMPVVRYLSSDPAGPRSVFAAFEFAAVPASGDPSAAADIIRRIYHFLTSADINLPPVVLDIEGSRQIGDVPLAVDVQAQVTDPVQAAAVKEVYWDFGDGSPKVKVNGPSYAASHTYTTPGVYRARLQVIDDQGEDTWASQTVVALPVGTRLLVVDAGQYSSEQAHMAGWQRLAAAVEQLRLPAVTISHEDLVDSSGVNGILNGAWDYLLLWTTGEVGFTDGPDMEGLAEFLDHHGRLILSGQDELFGTWPTPSGREFARKYLHVGDVIHDVGVPLIIGSPDSIARGLVIEPRPVYADWSDVIAPVRVDEGVVGAQPLFLRPINPDNFDAGFVPNALVYRGEDHSLVFTAFPLEFIPMQSLVAESEAQQLAAAAADMVARPRPGQLALLNQREGKASEIPANWPVYVTRGTVKPEELVPFTATLPQVLARAYSFFGGGTNVPPVILLAGVDNSGPVEPGTPILLVTAAEDVDGTITRATVDWGDGTPVQPVQVNQTHAYAAPGRYTLRVTYEDDQGAQSVATGEIAVRYFPQATVTPERVQIVLNRNAQAQATITVANSDDQGTLNFQVKTSSGASWLKVSPGQGQVTAGAQVDLRAAINTAGLNAGTYTASIQITTDDPEHTTFVVPVQVQVADATVQVLAPQAGDTWAGVKEIRWQAQDPDGDALSIKLEYSADEGASWKIIATTTENDGAYAWDTRQVGTGGDRFLIRVTAGDGAGHQAAATSGTFTIAVLRGKVTSGPNPAHDRVTFYYAVSGPATLYVYDVQGELVYQQALNPAANQYVWNLTDASGRPLASGLYLYVVVTEDAAASEVGRLTVVR